MTTGRDDPSLQRYRAASAELDERPSAQTRAAILAAAAREVDARPQSTAAPRAAVRRRWPLAAAATVLLSTLAVMMAARTEHEMPVFSAPDERVQEPQKVSPAPAAATVAPEAKVRAEEAPAAPAVRAPQAPAAPAIEPRAPAANASRAAAGPRATLDQSTQKSNGVAPARELQADAPSTVAPATLDKRDSAAERAADLPRVMDASPDQPARRALPSAAPPPAAPAATPPPAALGATSRAKDAAKPEALSAEQQRSDAAPASPASGAVGALRESGGARNQVVQAAHEWLERIVQLRRDGRAAEADVELARFRQQYPQVQVPAAALPPAGTR